MKSIIINYKIINDISHDRLRLLIDSCVSKRYIVVINLYDFSLGKITKGLINNQVNINIIDKDYEDIKKSDSLICGEMLKFADSSAIMIMDDNIRFLPDAIDLLEIDAFEDEHVGSMYCDYETEGALKIRSYLRSHPSHQIPILFLILSTTKVIQNLGEETPLMKIYHSHASKHIPNALCSVLANR